MHTRLSARHRVELRRSGYLAQHPHTSSRREKGGQQQRGEGRGGRVSVSSWAPETVVSDPLTEQSRRRNRSVVGTRAIF